MVKKIKEQIYNISINNNIFIENSFVLPDGTKLVIETENNKISNTLFYPIDTLGHAELIMKSINNCPSIPAKYYYKI